MNTHLKQLWAAMKLPKNFKKSYKFFCLGLDIRVSKTMSCKRFYDLRNTVGAVFTAWSNADNFALL